MVQQKLSLPEKKTPDEGSHLKTGIYMRLFVAGNEPNSRIARKNIGEICTQELKWECKLEIIDVFEDFDLAIRENILVTPALIIDNSDKIKILGNLEDKLKIITILKKL